MISIFPIFLVLTHFLSKQIEKGYINLGLLFYPAPSPAPHKAETSMAYCHQACDL